jgi:undecaprenyl-diphosphatase
MKNKKFVGIIAFIIILFILSVYFDYYIVEGVSYIKNSFLDEIFLGLTFTSSNLIIFFLLTSLFLWNENKRKWILPLWFTLFLSTLASFILKVAIQRPRPFQQGLMEISSFLVKNSYAVWDFSFPSNHTLVAFCAVPLLSKEFPRLKYVWIVLACLVGFSRLYFGFHFLSDIIAGAAIGYLIGAVIIKSEKESKFWEKVYWNIKSKFMR